MLFEERLGGEERRLMHLVWHGMDVYLELLFCEASAKWRENPKVNKEIWDRHKL